MMSFFIASGMYSVAAAIMLASANFTALAVAFSRTKLCPIAIFGIVPVFFRTTFRVSPGFAVIEVTLYFISLPTVMTTSRGWPAAAGVAGLGAGVCLAAGAA